MRKNNLRMYRFVISSLLLLLLGTRLMATDNTLRLASVLNSNMVIQQSKPFTVWGFAAPASIVTVQTSWKEKVKVKVNTDGTWKGSIRVPAVKRGDYTAHTITVVNLSQTKVLTNILIGEVWLCSGQSNMDMSMQPVQPWHNGVSDHVNEIAKADYPNIRLFKVKKETAVSLSDTLSGEWLPCNPVNVAAFSGVAYYFGRKLFNELNIPIGLVQAAYGGASCQAFMKKEVLEADTLLKKRYLDPYYESPEAKKIELRPTLIYNAMIHPLINLSIKGVLWYQGESNAGEIKLYPILNAALIKSWRNDFNQPDLPFFYVQMTPYNWKNTNPALNNYARFREAQASILSLIHNTGMVCTMDVGEPDNIHPVNKRPVGERLAALALNKSYGVKTIICNGPAFDAMTVDGDKIKIKFKYADGLITNNDLPPLHFFIAGPDKVFKQAQAEIKGNEVWLYSKEISKPSAVRYAFTNDCISNLLNKHGFPALPFRTDNWIDEQVIFSVTTDKK